MISFDPFRVGYPKGMIIPGMANCNAFHGKQIRSTKTGKLNRCEHKFTVRGNMAVLAENIVAIEYDPSTNRNLLQYSILRVRVRVRQRQIGRSGPFRVVIRTNLNQGQRIRRQIIDQVEKGQSYSTDYYDIMTRYDSALDEYFVDVLLGEVGYFEFKVRVESVSHQRPWVKWAQGENVGISVTPLEYSRNNSLYCAFIRQYSEAKDHASLIEPLLEDNIIRLEKHGAYVLPPGGNFEQFKEVLPFIIDELGMKIIHLLPINPVPTSYGRMGMYGSPYATTDYFGIDHTYGSFSQYKTIEEQFIDLTSTVHGLGGKVFLDIVINHTGWASSLLFTHRKWFKTAPDGKLISPGAWDVTWGDLVELDYKHKDLWQYMAGVFLAWCQRGIDGFRLDAGYMIPIEVWQYIISKVRQEFPDTMFLLEGLGGPWETTEKLLTHGQSNWAYSELFQNYTRRQIVDYLDYAQKVSAGKGTLVHYAETHDNDRLAGKGKIYTLMRLHLCAFTSFDGAWGFTNGVEWLATEKIDVHRNTGLNWNNPDNLVDEISRINRILAENPAFWHGAKLEVINAGNDDVLCFTRHNPDMSNVVACIINLNTEKPHKIKWNFALLAPGDFEKEDFNLRNLLTDKTESLPKSKTISRELSPGQCLLYRFESKEKPYTATIPALFDVNPDRITMIYHILLNRFAPHEVGTIDQEKLLRQVTSLRKFIALINSVSLDYLCKCDISDALDRIDSDQVDRYSALWTFRASSKEFIISGDKWLVVHTYVPCTAYLKTSSGTLRMDSIAKNDGLGYLTFFPPQPGNEHVLLSFNWKIKRGKMIQRQKQPEQYPILSVPSGRQTPPARRVYPLKLDKQQIQQGYSTVLLTNGKGTCCQTPAMPGILNSKYDAIFSMLLDKSNPTNRTALVKTVTETLQVGQKYFDLDESFLVSFTRYPHPVWEFYYDDGKYHVRLERSMVMPNGEDSLYIRYKVCDANTTINLTSKCCLEFRSIHDQVQANDNKGLQDYIVASCKKTDVPPGVRFTPADDIDLRIIAKQGEFIDQPHWIFDQEFAQDAENGLESKGDMFAPGVFRFELGRKSTVTMLITTEPLGQQKISIHKAETGKNRHFKELTGHLPVTACQKDPMVKMLVWNLDQFLVKTDSRWTMLAGYPWLGMRTRDTLHSIGGILAAGRDEPAADLIGQTAATAVDGLLAEWIPPGDAPRCNVEASLRLFTAAKSYVDSTACDAFWDRGVDSKRSLRQVLVSIYENFRKTQSSTVHLDADSGLLYCPAGFSWMNTNHPRATPREGYPIEVQALWYRILPILAEICPDYATEANELHTLIRERFMDMFWDESRGYLADVLLTQPKKTSPASALADASLRVNQLAAVNSDLVPPEHARQVVDIIASRLLIPAGVRSLAEDTVPVPLEIFDDRGHLLTDPHMLYQGKCIGDERTRRLAYHNGTAWPSIYPSFIEARATVFHYSDLAVRQALAFFEPVWTEMTVGGIGCIPEMKDGNYPHHPRGCFSFALANAETLRIYMKLKYNLNNTLNRHTETTTTRSTQ